ncbi:hypothetical protein AB0K68_53440, partial [Streptomyces sp. NPDC050698]
MHLEGNILEDALPGGVFESYAIKLDQGAPNRDRILGFGQRGFAENALDVSGSQLAFAVEVGHRSQMENR